MYREIAQNELRILKPHGYVYFLDRYHPLASSKTYMVYYHRHVISIHLGRWITSEEVVHHIDEDKSNNSIENLMLMSREEHSRIHNPGLLPILCKTCGANFVPERKTTEFCSDKCSKVDRVKNKNITKEELQKLIDNRVPWTKMAELYGYSNNGIKKRAISLGCILPKR
jgi:endogenous inhibitor of DNA gyrase (YacG/DUF329 family)